MKQESEFYKMTLSSGNKDQQLIILYGCQQNLPSGIICSY